jgi:hypothetical protein
MSERPRYPVADSGVCGQTMDEATLACGLARRNSLDPNCWNSCNYFGIYCDNHGSHKTAGKQLKEL